MEDAPSSLPAVTVQWRIEVQKRGKYWQWRRGSRQKRVSRYGGKFELLPDERKEQYEVNKARLARTRASTGEQSRKAKRARGQSNHDHGTRSPAAIAERNRVSTIGRDNGTGEEHAGGIAADNSGSALFDER
jgi:hypothetical protein